MALITKIKTVYTEVIAALGFTPENAANKGQPNGYAGLDAGGRVPASQLPAYVDDVQEYANLASFPATGSAGILYLALDTNIIYRWGGSTYIEITSGEVTWSSITGKPAFGTMSLQDANTVNITGGSANVTSAVVGNLSLSTNQITSTETSGDISIAATGTGAVDVTPRLRVDGETVLGLSDTGGAYLAVNGEYVLDGILSAWKYINNGRASKLEFENSGGFSYAYTANGLAGNPITAWIKPFEVNMQGSVTTGNWTAGVINSTYGGTGVNNAGKTLTLTANATLSGTNTGDQTNITGNAGTATALQTARTINGVSFNGTANITLTANTTQALTISGPLTGTSFNGGTATTIGITTANSTLGGALTSADWTTFNGKQAALSGTGIVKSTSGTISYLTDNSANWNTAYNRSITSAAVTGTTTKTLTLNKQDGTNVTASWTDINTVTSVFGRTGAVVAAEGDYSLTQLSDVTLNASAAGQLLQNNGTAWVNWTPDYLPSANYTASDVLAKLITVDGAGSGLDADTVDGLHVTADTVAPVWPSVPRVSTNGVLEIGRYIDFHPTSGDSNNYNVRLDAGATSAARTILFPSSGGTLVGTGDSRTVSANMLANTTVVAGVYGNATAVSQITVDAQGRATAAANVTITPAWSSITSTPTTLGGYGITDAVASSTYTASDVLAKLKTVDGAGSGLDADLLDGVALNSAASTTGPTWPSIPLIKSDGVMEIGRYIDFHDTSNDGIDYRVRLQTGGVALNRGINLPAASGTLVGTGDSATVSNTMLAGSISDDKLSTISTAGKVANTATTATSANTASAIVARDASGNFSAGTITASLNGAASNVSFAAANQVLYKDATNVATGSAALTFNGTNLTCTGNVVAYSDERLKKDWKTPAEDFIEQVAQAKCGTYERTDLNLRQAGSSAQDWAKILPEVVNESDSGLLSMAYGNAALVTAIMLARRVLELEERIKALESK